VATQGLDELPPVHRSQKSEAADAVADADLVCRLLLVFRLNQLFDRQTRLGEPLLDPGKRQCQRGALSLQLACKLRDERAHHWRPGPRHVRRNQNQALRILLNGLRHSGGPMVSLVSSDPSGAQAGSHPAQILDQRQPEHDWNCP
jgi:hypothetical protein